MMSEPLGPIHGIPYTIKDLAFTKGIRTMSGSHIFATRVPDVDAARAELEAKGVEFDGETIETSVCRQAWFKDPDGNALMLHRRFDV